MAAAIFRLLTLVALVLMPLGMAVTPAVGQSMPNDHAARGMVHCDDQSEPDQTPVPKMECTAMCIALPATDNPAPRAIAMPKAPLTIAPVSPFTGVVLEPATPPPRRV